MDYTSNSLEDTQKIAAELAKKVWGSQMSPKKAKVIGLYGELGSGKTTFMKYFAEALGVKETIQSPTFVIMKIYNTSPPRKLAFSSPPLLVKERGPGGEVCKLIHIDAYRLESGEDLLKLGWDELVADPHNLICIEWPERVTEILPEHIMVRFEHAEGAVSAEGPERSERIRETERKIFINHVKWK